MVVKILIRPFFGLWIHALWVPLQIFNSVAFSPVKYVRMKRRHLAVCWPLWPLWHAFSLFLSMMFTLVQTPFYPKHPTNHKTPQNSRHLKLPKLQKFPISLIPISILTNGLGAQWHPVTLEPLWVEFGRRLSSKWLILKFFPECIAKGSRFSLGVCGVTRSCLQPLSTVCEGPSQG